MIYIGKLDKNKISDYINLIITDNVIMTDERIDHTKYRHGSDYETYLKYIPDIIKNPNYVLEDRKNKNTLLFLKKVTNNQLNILVVVKLQVNIEDKFKSNSILSFWHIRNRCYENTVKNNKILYKSLDTDE